MDEEVQQAIRRHVARRIAHGRDLLGGSQERFARELTEFTGDKWTRAMVVNLETGRKAVGVEALLAIAQLQGRAIEWYYADLDANLRERFDSAIPGYRSLLTYPRAAITSIGPGLRARRVATPLPA